MKQKWQADISVEKDQAIGLIQGAFPDLLIKAIQLLGIGWDNTAYLINQKYVFRFPRRKIAKELIEIEAACLPQIAKQLPVAVPKPIYMGKPTKAYPWPFMGYHLLKGTPACHMRLSDKEKCTLAAEIAKFLKKLHGISANESIRKNLPTDTLDRLNVEHRLAKLEELLKHLEQLKLFSDPNMLKKLSNVVYAKPKKTTIVHGDFYIRHLLIDSSKHLSAVIDWGDMHFSDPAIDLSILFSFLPQSAHEEFIKNYGEISQETLDLAKMRAAYSLASLVVYGHHIQDGLLKAEGLKGLKMLSNQLQ